MIKVIVFDSVRPECSILAAEQLIYFMEPFCAGIEVARGVRHEGHVAHSILCKPIPDYWGEDANKEFSAYLDESIQDAKIIYRETMEDYGSRLKIGEPPPGTTIISSGQRLPLIHQALVTLSDSVIYVMGGGSTFGIVEDLVKVVDVAEAAHDAE